MQFINASNTMGRIVAIFFNILLFSLLGQSLQAKSDCGKYVVAYYMLSHPWAIMFDYDPFVSEYLEDPGAHGLRKIVIEDDDLYDLLYRDESRWKREEGFYKDFGHYIIRVELHDGDTTEIINLSRTRFFPLKINDSVFFCPPYYRLVLESLCKYDSHLSDCYNDPVWGPESVYVKVDVGIPKIDDSLLCKIVMLARQPELEIFHKTKTSIKY